MTDPASEASGVPPAGDGAPEFSAIITCYFEQESIAEFHERLSRTLAGLGRSYEIVMVNDGSTDGTFEALRTIFERDPHVTTVLDLYRNSGQTAAMTAGLSHARGRAFIFMDSDLQVDPEELPLLVEEFDKGMDIVGAWRQNRVESWLRTIPSWLANRVMRRLSNHALRDFSNNYKIYDAKLVRAFGFGPLRPWRTAYVFSRAQRCSEVPVMQHPRKHGSSGYTFGRRLSFFMDHAVGLSERPFQLISAACVVLALLLLVRISLAWVFPVSILPPTTNGLLLNALVVHLLLTLSVLAAVGEYVIRNFLALQGDPVYIVRQVISRVPGTDAEAASRE